MFTVGHALLLGGLAATVTAQTGPSPPPCAACIVAAGTPGQLRALEGPLHGIELMIKGGADDVSPELLRSLAERGGRPGVWIDGAAGMPADHAALTSAHRVVVDLSAEPGTPDEVAFRAKSYLTDLRGAAPSVTLGIHAPAAVLDALRERGIRAYIDFEARAAGQPAPFPLAAPPGPVVTLHETGTAGAGSSNRWIVPLPADAGHAAAMVRDITVSAQVLVDGLVRGGLVDVRCGPQTVATYLNPASLETVALGPACAGAEYTAQPEAPVTVRATLTNGQVLMTVAAPPGGFAEGVSVVGARRLSVREVIARHQAAAARQRRDVRELISSGQMTLTFEAPGFPAPMTITTEAVLYIAGGSLEIEQRDVRVNGIAFSRDAVPRLPLLEPERVVSPPLVIALDDAYRYDLDDEEDTGGVRCHVVRFEPVDARRPLFRGRAWIAVDDFSLVKVSAVQTGLRGAIVSSEQTDEFRRDRPGVWLLARSEVRQIYEGAGHRTPIHRVLALQRHEVNPPGFTARRQAAYASPSIMLRDTPEGFRYLVRTPASGPAGTIEPTVADSSKRVRTIAVGVIFDPNISRPLPFAGLSYVDFDLFGTGTQMNGFFGGTYGQLAIAVPSLGGTRWQLGGRAFGIASSYNDRAFVEGREIYAANISQRPAHASAWLLRPLSARVTIRAGYDFDYTAYGRVDSTSPSFEVPAAQAAHALRLGLEGQWSGWAASVWWAGARRAGWRAWGEAGGEYLADHRDYQRFGATASRSFVASPRVVGRVEAAWMTGHDLDRFSRYSFGSFDNRLRGFPAALVRYDSGGVFRTAVAWAPSRFLRVDGFADTARVRDPGFGREFRSYTGIGTAAEVPAPFGTLLAVEWGYGFQGLDSEGRRGTRVVRISGYKMF